MDESTCQSSLKQFSVRITHCTSYEIFISSSVNVSKARPRFEFTNRRISHCRIKSHDNKDRILETDKPHAVSIVVEKYHEKPPPARGCGRWKDNMKRHAMLVVA